MMNRTQYGSQTLPIIAADPIKHLTNFCNNTIFVSKTHATNFAGLNHYVGWFSPLFLNYVKIKFSRTCKIIMNLKKQKTFVYHWRLSNLRKVDKLKFSKHFSALKIFNGYIVYPLKNLLTLKVDIIKLVKYFTALNYFNMNIHRKYMC